MSDMWLPLSLAIVALLFACVGQAGAPCYVAVMSVFGFAPSVIKPTALALTMLASGIRLARA